jgi:hypothetical protein
MKIIVLFTISSVVFLSGCASPKDDLDPAVTACQDFIDVVVERGGDCGLPEGQLRDELNDTLACDRFTNIRNETELRGACFTAYMGLSCSQITMGSSLPASCTNQFSRVAASTGALSEQDAGEAYEPTSSLPVVEAAAACAGPRL